MSKPAVIVVDAFSSGNQLAPILIKHNIDVIHLFSMKDVSSALMATYYPEHFVREYTYEGNIADLMAKIHADYPQIKAVIAGTETAITLTDELAGYLKLPGNNPHTSKSRYNKYQMIESLRDAKVEVAAQTKAQDAAEIIEWKRQNNWDKIVLKPLESAGSDCVFACRSEDDIRAAFAQIIGKKNQMGGENAQVLAQSFLDGEEYYVNAVSCNKEHFICEVWRYHKRHLNGRDFVYDYNEYIILDQNQPQVAALCNYMYRVLDALDFAYGPSHAEIKLTSTGPKLVEIGARLQGMAAFGINSKTMGFTPAELSVDSYLFPQQFAQKTINAKPQPIFARRVFVTSNVNGKLKAYNYHGEIENLPSCIYLRWVKQPGDVLKPTIDYFSIPAIAVLAHHDAKQVEEDYRFIREFEKRDLFVMENSDE
ncbi:ATP-grasp domain-containing protein [Candidatus Uabimicrobium amorphum]|uniref:ATP-grasp domain-containing protein n=1 Tax=Uabimicrobium amorphum TaxID=2596890 RepID=A0A5S9IU83_UABAM|nr:ATP-grasp domain-containing protein [Candidatus Uabimicrobium amorphum]BBM87260.1 hypothetical protein UABAM_05663 [Candidatus Uabimicrobium amorphum]